jgi:Transposase IS116/IS110/IS902 family
MSPLVGDLGQADLAVLERYADPHALLGAGHARLTRMIARASNGHLGSARANQWLAAAHAALELCGNHPAVAFADLAAEVTTEVRLLRATQAELELHAGQREARYRQVDPDGLARSLPGLATIGGPALVATMGHASRFATAAKFRSFTGLAPRASETGDTDRKGQPISKAGSRLLRTTLHRAADTARRQDPQLARIYWIQMVERGKVHLGALCVVAAHLGERAWAVMDRGMPYVICDTDGVPSPPSRPRPSSPSASPCPNRSASGGVTGRGRPLNKSSQDMCMALKAQRGDPPPRRPVLNHSHPPSSQPRQALDSQSSIGNQRRVWAGMPSWARYLATVRRLRWWPWARSVRASSPSERGRSSEATTARRLSWADRAVPNSSARANTRPSGSRSRLPATARLTVDSCRSRASATAARVSGAWAAGPRRSQESWRSAA